MRVYGVDFKITEECLDMEQALRIPGEGVIIPILIDTVYGFYDYLVRNRCIRKFAIEMIYIFSTISSGAVLCVKYKNGTVAVIQNIGEADFNKDVLHNNI